MKKFLVIFMVLLTFAIIGGAAYAEDIALDTATSQSDTVTPPASTTKIDKNDPLYLSIQQKDATRKGLIAAESQIQAAITAQNKTNSSLRKSLLLDPKGPNNDAIQTLEGQIKDARTQSASISSQRKDLRTQLSDAVKAKDKTLEASLKTQINALNDQSKAQKGIIAGFKTSLDAAKAADKVVNDKTKDVRAQIRTINIQILNLDSSITSLRASNESELTAFNDSIKNANLTDANTHIDNIINYKQQIIDKLNQVLALKKQIDTTLTSLASNNN